MLNINKVRILKAQAGLQFPNFQYPNFQIPTLNGNLPIPNAQKSWEEGLTQQLFQNPFLQPQPFAVPYKDSSNGLLRSTYTSPPEEEDPFPKNTWFTKLKKNILSNSELLGTGLSMINQNLLQNVTNSSVYDNLQTGANAIAHILGKGNPALGMGIQAGVTAMNGINKAFSKKVDTFSIDQGVRNNLGGGYQGTYNFMDEAASHSGESIGLFNRGDLHRFNRNAAKATNFQKSLSEINKKASDAKNNYSNLAAINYNQKLNGGLDFRYATIAKYGGRIKNLKNIDYTPNQEIEPIIDITNYKPNQDFEPTISLFQEGGKTKSQSEITFQSWFNSIPPEYRAPQYDYQMAFNILDKELLKNHAKDPNQFHLPSVSGIEDKDGRIPFLKLGRRDENKEVDMEFTEFYESDKGKNFRNKYDVIYDKDRYYYVPKKFEEGGNLSKKDSKSEFKETSQKNIIPEGALHAHKHHMENSDNITKKGIPVVDNDGEQQAEIEREEIIFTLEVTKKLEELYKEYYESETKQTKKDELAIEAGKILVYEILHNTEDKADLIKKCKKGGTL